MAARTFKGGAQTVAQTATYTITDTPDDTETLIFTFTDPNSAATQAETYTIAIAVDSSIAVMLPLIVAMLQRSSKSIFQRLNFSHNGVDTFTISSKYAGEPWSLAITGTAGAQVALVTYATGGPHDLLDDQNYAEITAITGSDDLTMTGAASVFYNLKAGSTTGGFTTTGDFTGTVGQLGAPMAQVFSSVVINGRGYGHLNIGNSAITPIFNGTANSPLGAPAWTIIGSAMTGIVLNGGSVGVAIGIGQTATIGDVIVTGGNHVLGVGLTLSDDIFMTGGKLTVRGTIGDDSSISGDAEIILEGAAASTGTITVKGNGKVRINTTGTIAMIDMQSNDAMVIVERGTVTDLTRHAGTLYYNPDTTTFTNARVEYGGETAPIIPPEV